MAIKSKNVKVGTKIQNLINFIKIEHLKRGKKPPTSDQILNAYVRRTKKEEILFEDFIKL